MDTCSQFVGRYKKDMSIENLRAKVARRKSITQKENRHKEFRKSRGLSLADVNVSLVKEQGLTVVEEGNEPCLMKGQENKPANKGKTREQIIKEERHAMLQRFKEEKQLRKLKEQREKASKGVFKCGIYKPEGSLIPVFTSQTAAKVKPKEKPPAPSVPRVTRATLKVDPPAIKTRTQVIPVNVLTNKAPIDRAIPRGRAQTSVVKKNESKVSGIPSARTTRSAAKAAVKAPVKNPPAIKPQKKPLREISPEMMIDKTEPPVSDHSNERVLEPEPEPVLKDAHVESETLPETSPEEPERKPSFAPQNFVFQPLDGLSTFQFQPMTPKRANAFLTPTFTWSPQDGNRAFVVTREHNVDHKEDVQSPNEQSQMATEVKLEVDLNASPQDAVLECACDANSSPQTNPAMSPPPCEPRSEDNKTTQPEEAPHDVPYFRSILKSEIQQLTVLCSDWDKRIDMDIPEDAKDLIRTTVGQTRLLMTERFKQFEGLVDNCEFKRGEKETTCTDLDGFWDMVYFQIEDVRKKFVNLGKLEENSWQQDTSQTKKVVRKKIAPVASGKQNQGDNGRAAARGRLAAIKAAMKNRIKMEAPCAEVEALVIPMQVDPIVFDAGFFRIESPAKIPGSLRTNRSSSRSNTPKSTTKTVQNSATPVPNGIENTADVKSEKSPSPGRSPVKKALFGVPEEESCLLSLQNQEADPVLQSPEHTEMDSVPAEVDLTKYLSQAQTLSLGAEESPGLIKCLGLDTSKTQDGCDAEVAAETSMRVDDCFMCSPEKVAPETEASCLPETSEPGPDDGLRTNRSPSRSNTPKSTTKTVQNSATPVPNGIENMADVKSEKSPSPGRSPVKKALFGVSEEESLQNQEADPVLQSPEHTEMDSVPAEVDLTKYLSQAQTLSLGAEESPGLIKCLGLDSSKTQDECDAEVAAETSMRVEDVFMCSPEKVAPETEASCLPETSEPGPDDVLDMKTTSDPLDFLGSCTPIMVKHTPMMFESADAFADLMTFSPMEQ